MGSSSDKEKEEKDEKEETNKKNNPSESKECKKSKSDTIKEAETHENTNRVNPYNEINEINKNIPIKTFESKASPPIDQKKNIFKLYKEKDNNLEITNYFNQGNVGLQERYFVENIRRRYQEIIYEINNKRIDYDDNYDRTNLQINSLFGFNKSIKDDFDRTKINILYCSSLNAEDEMFINGLDYNEYIKDEKKYRKLLAKVIKNNLKEIVNNIKKK